MRIVVVSAHYPPNFVSGGTLVPQRLAWALRERGHDVSVFAGRLDAGAEPLTELDEVDEHGVPVHWVVTTPWTGYEDRRNWDNPPVADAFARHLDTVRPDVVHLHSVQTLGGPLVSVAADHGARTLLTMHDFWWVCARQFLVDTSMQPCSLVVDAGVCQCAAGRDSLDERTAELMEHVDRADVVLAPSEMAAAVLRANGVALDRLHVDENGMIDPARVDHPARAEVEPVRFRYTGGVEVMKGAAVLAEAVKLLDDLAGWRLTVHVPLDRLGPFGELAGHPRVDLKAPYVPSDLGDLLAATDAIVLPSVMRETHSIATREALLHGVPVVTTDSLGPEEVIEDGHNGIIVPSADPTSLAGAIRRVVTEEGLLDRLRAGTADVRVRTFREQVDGVEALMRERQEPATSDDWTPDHVLFVVGIDGAPLRYRAQFPAEALGLLGIRTTVLHYNDPRIESTVDGVDAAVFYRVPATPRILRLIQRIRDAGRPVAFDVDDLIVDPDASADIAALRLLPPDEAELWLEGVCRYRTTLEHTDAYIGSTAALVDRIGGLTGLPAYRYENSYGLALGRLSDVAWRDRREAGPLRIGYLSGTTTHDEDLRFVEPVLADVLTDHHEVEVWLGGHLPPTTELDRFGDRVRRLPFQSWTRLPGLLRQLDVNLAVLADRASFNQAKSAIKWLEAALVGTPTIASPTGPFVEAVDPWATGVLADGADEWRDALTRLLDDAELRARIGAAARRRALLDWSPHLQAPRYLDILRRVRDDRSSRPRASSWTPVTVDEPASGGPIPLEPYPPTDEMASPPGPGEPGLAEKLRWSIRNESPGDIARRVLRKARAATRPDRREG